MNNSSKKRYIEYLMNMAILKRSREMERRALLSRDRFRWNSEYEKPYKDITHHHSSSIMAPLPVNNFYTRLFEFFKDANNRVIVAAISTVLATIVSYKVASDKVEEIQREREESRVLQRTSISESDLSVSPKKMKSLSANEKRFIKFASVSYNCEPYMTPLDFLQSLLESDPPPRYKRIVLTDADVQRMHSALPVHNRRGELQSSSSFFRSIANQGIISCSEYLFLLTIVTKPRSGINVAFSMLDADGNENIDKKEFLLLEKVFSTASSKRKRPSDQENFTKFSTTSSQTVMGDQDTTLLSYFFGTRGDKQLKYQDFKQFVSNLQTEILEMEFNEFSKGTNVINEVDFVRILLRYTNIDTIEYDVVINRLMKRLETPKGITFDEFKDFSLFLNCLDDFQIAMKMYTFADRPITQDEFHRAVFVCTNGKLSRHLVHVVFQIFDSDGDGQLSHQEFIHLMKDRVKKKNLKKSSDSNSTNWNNYKKCVSQEFKNNRSSS